MFNPFFTTRSDGASPSACADDRRAVFSVTPDFANLRDAAAAASSAPNSSRCRDDDGRCRPGSPRLAAEADGHDFRVAVAALRWTRPRSRPDLRLPIVYLVDDEGRPRCRPVAGPAAVRGLCQRRARRCRRHTPTPTTTGRAARLACCSTCANGMSGWRCSRLHEYRSPDALPGSPDRARRMCRPRSRRSGGSTCREAVLEQCAGRPHRRGAEGQRRRVQPSAARRASASRRADRARARAMRLVARCLQADRDCARERAR